MIWALIEDNIVVNIIEYDGVAQYTPAEGLSLVQIPDSYAIGDTVEE